MRVLISSLLMAGSLLIGCTDSFEPDFEQESVMGFKPIYADGDQQLALESARAIELAGKIYAYQNLLFVNEVGKGVHIFDNTDPKNPTNLRFLSIPGNNDVAIKKGVMYADSYNDLLALEVTQDTVLLLKRIESVMGFSEEYPFENNSYFECVDPEKGKVVGWERTELEKPKCYRP
ncbi:hypothetical protein [Marinoscillum furvescens]|uniref:LVIVD repeat-containing protein n=1 Tax=Marinoscillum furvescens DSM 4134 TaxID=1122208 RepID=A0A3D9L1P1_MARFU|nr:hypothetical protein [Marinoscillum furvescens]RED97976.1 hypothetical protein C7460_111117 [Marinoscillum furvescens DSM 4134]